MSAIFRPMLFAMIIQAEFQEPAAALAVASPVIGITRLTAIRKTVTYAASWVTPTHHAQVTG